ncbi:putative translation initiation factor eif4e3 protein [Phaeoacremonium minimum UCRPA7]|uniref:Putative translation initiation factor eif4e3 protein n=1 Tax=Phaeoacremonium minimum (strain UCR-PA7) TaxID=1286976 RepID=R8BQ24_PHAM7|nr:putative translation initiation factor eif4e3 protein [Phaeoacremonium minimum UCRPA7]EOO01451.1 putative translation initiation factor eif4e3 protein [Phaeoacremonium minimum UCRPA7]
MDNLWSRRTNSSKLSLSTSGTGQNDSSSSGRNASFSKRFGGDSSSHGKSNPFNSVPAPGSGLASPGASSAFGLGSGAFASFGSAKTPKSPGNPFDFALKTPGAEKSAKDASLGSFPASASKGAAAAKPAAGGALSKSSAHSLRNSWVFWFRPPIPKSNGYIAYEKTVHAVANCDTVEEFFAVYAHLKRPSTLPLVSDYHLFKKGIRPIWEDDENKKGGKWIVRLKKGVADRYWEDLILAIIGDQFGEASEEVCGAVMSVRNGEDILSIWTRTDGGRVLKIRETMKRVLNFPPDTKVEFKSHDESIQQRITIEESRREKQNSHHHADKRSGKQQSEDQKANQAS